jgi:hypothetical protein
VRAWIRRQLSWRAWLCPLLVGMIAVALDIEVLSWRFLLLLAAFELGTVQSALEREPSRAQTARSVTEPAPETQKVTP